MKRSKSSVHWIEDHENDEYVQRARREGYRSRACYKLIEIDNRYQLLKPGMTVVDLGAAPGGWTQVAVRRVGTGGRVVGIDILDMKHLPGAELIKGDFTSDEALAELMQCLDGAAVDLVISDMAPNMSGIKDIDQPQVMYLAELALDMTKSVLKPGAYFLVKVFQGEGFEYFRQELRKNFDTVKTRKPKASRPQSHEIYLLAGDYSG